LGQCLTKKSAPARQPKDSTETTSPATSKKATTAPTFATFPTSKAPTAKSSGATSRSLEARAALRFATKLIRKSIDLEGIYDAEADYVMSGEALANYIASAYLAGQAVRL
jgi:hypothetical protein